MSDEELYAIEKWVGRIEANRAPRDGEQHRLDNSPMGIALRHLNTLTAEIRRLQGEIDRLHHHNS